MKKLTPKSVIIFLMIIILLLKKPMSQSIALANLYSVIISVAFDVFIVCLTLLDSWDENHTKNIVNLDASLLFKYRSLTVLFITLIMVSTVFELFFKSSEVIEFFLLISALFALWFRGRYAQGTQTKFSNKTIIIYLVLILFIYLCGQFI